jgi:hypothetical protein
MYANRIQNVNESERGSALAMIILSVAGLAALSAAMMTVSLSSAKEQGAASRESQAEYICQAGLSQAMYQMARGLSPTVGSSQVPLVWGGGQTWVTSAVAGDDLTRLTGSGIENGVGRSQELVVRAVPNSIWTYAMFGRDGISLASTVRVDSYDSTLGSYASQVIGAGTDAHAQEDGTVGSNGDILVQEVSQIWGNAIPGPGHEVQLSGGAVSGSTTPAPVPVVYPPINVPTYTNYGSLSVNSNTTIPTGDRTYNNLVVKANKILTINGPAHIVMSNLTMFMNAKILINDALGPVTLTVIDNFILNSNSVIKPISENPANLRLNMLSDNVADPEVVVQLDTIDLASNSTITGCVYAPEANIVLDSYFSLYGSLMARSLDLDSNANFHFDEHLLEALAEENMTYELVSWRSIPFQD